MPGLAPVGGSPVGALLADDAFDLSDYIGVATALADYLNGRIPLDVTSAAAWADAVSEQRLYSLYSRIVAADVVTNQATLLGDLSDSVAFVDVISAAWWMLLADTADAADSTAYLVRKSLVLADALLATGVADSKLTAYAACAVAIALEDQAKAGWSMNLADQAALVDAVQNKLTAILAVADSAALSDTAAGSLRLSLVCADSVDVDDSPAALLRMNADINDGALLYCSFRLGGTEYSGWAVNTDLRAATEHRNQNFDAIVSHPKGFHYAAGPGGIIQFLGDTDDGEPIEAWFRTFLTDFGTHKFKRVPDIWVGLATDGRMLAKVRTRDPNTGAVLDDWYELVTKQDGNEGNGRAKVGRGLKSVWWGLELRNIAGADFRVDEASLRALVLDRRQ